jgi:hypothetical protein
MKALGTFLIAAGLSAALHGQLSSCGFGGDCSCPPVPDLPARQAALPIVQAQAWTTQGDEDVLPANPEGGTVEIDGDEVTIRYLKDGESRQLVYDVVPAL